MSKVVGSFTSQTGMFTIKSKLRYGLGSVSSEQLHKVATGKTKRKTSTMVPMRRFAQGTTSCTNLQRENMQQNHNGNPSSILITKSSLRQVLKWKKTLLIPGHKTIHTEKLNEKSGKTHGGPESRDTNLPLNPEGRIKHCTSSFLLPEDCVKEQKQVISGILESIETQNKEKHCGNDCRLTQKENEVCYFSICK